jgi:hypothetical protein
MKNIISMLILMIGLFVSVAIGNQVTDSMLTAQTVLPSTSSGRTISATATSSVEASVGDLVPVETGNFFTRNWGVLVMGLLGFADLVTRLTPTAKDNSIVNFLVSVFNAIIPNLKKGGGRL